MTPVAFDCTTPVH